MANTPSRFRIIERSSQKLHQASPLIDVGLQFPPLHFPLSGQPGNALGIDPIRNGSSQPFGTFPDDWGRIVDGQHLENLFDLPVAKIQRLLQFPNAHSLFTFERLEHLPYPLLFRPRRLVMDHKPKVRLVVSHAESCGCNQRLDFVSVKGALQALTVFVRVLVTVIENVRVVRANKGAALVQPSGNLLGVARCQRVDDAGAW